VAYASESTPDGRWLLAVSMTANKLFVVDLQSLKVVRSFETPERSSEILIRPDGVIAYVSGDRRGKDARARLLSWKMQPSIDLILASMDGFGSALPINTAKATLLGIAKPPVHELYLVRSTPNRRPRHR